MVRRPESRGGLGADERVSVVKCCLRKHLLLPEALPVIEDYVQNTSRILHHGSLLASHYVCHLLEAGDVEAAGVLLGDQMFFYGAFSAVSGATRTKHAGLLEFYNAKRELYPQGLTRMQGDSQIINAAAKKLLVNTGTYLRTTLHGRVVSLARLRLPGLTKAEARAVAWRVRGMTRYARAELEEDALSLVAECRRRLGFQEADGDEVDDRWIDCNQGRVAGFLAWVLGQVPERDPASEGPSARRSPLRRFPVLPVMSQKRHFISISSDALRNVMVRAGALPRSVSTKDFLTLADDHRRSVFRARRDWKLGDTVETDGVALCIHLRKRALVPGAASGSAGGRPAKRRKCADSSSSREPLAVAPGARVVGVDPGRCNIAAVVEVSPDGSERRVRLTRKQYYNDSHARDNLVKIQRRDRGFVPREMDALSATVWKTASVAQLEGYLATKRSVDARLWEHRLLRRTSVIAMDTYIHKRRTLDRFWKRTVGLGPGVVVAFGDAGFASSGPGEKSVPRTKSLDAARRFGDVRMVDEYNTTKCCCRCGSETLPVYAPGNPKPLRSVRRCGSTECSEAPLLSRDYSAATNMYWKLVDPGRVPWLQREN